jgi:hypothetical protein
VHPQRVLTADVAVTILTAGCSQGSSVQVAPKSSALSAPKPAGSSPSSLAVQICATEAREGIASTLGETAVVSTPNWSSAQHLYSCTYRYPNGSFTISMKELSSWPQTYAYFDSLRTQLGEATDLENLGQGAFQSPNGSVVVRKDWKVLLIDASALPARFGVPADPSSTAAVAVAEEILSCWAGD